MMMTLAAGGEQKTLGSHVQMTAEFPPLLDTLIYLYVTAPRTLSQISRSHPSVQMPDPSVTKHDGTADQPQIPDQRRQACLALLALVKARSDPLFQPSPLASKQLLDNFAGEDPDNPSVRLSTPRATADRYMELYHNAQHMRAML